MTAGPFFAEMGGGGGGKEKLDTVQFLDLVHHILLLV